MTIFPWNDYGGPASPLEAPLFLSLFVPARRAAGASRPALPRAPPPCDPLPPARRLGGHRWRRLHQLVYAIGVLAVIHYCLQSKLDLWEPTVMAGLLAWLLAYRLLTWRVGVRGQLPLTWVGGLSLAAALVAALGEAAYFRLAVG